MGALARSDLRELRLLSIGNPAPDIVGVDLALQPLKLSDYRGKVVLLVFWASWCGPCMADVPHEKELFARFSNRPFAMVGVNGDGSANAAAKAVSTHGIPWKSFWTGSNSGGDIARQWNIEGWPTVYVIDHTGIIREKYRRGGDLDHPLEDLVRAAELAQARP